MEHLLRSDEELFLALVEHYGETDIGIDTDCWCDIDEAIESLVFTTLEAARISAIMEQKQNNLVACSDHQLLTLLRTNFGEQDIAIDPDYWGDDEDAGKSLATALIFIAREKARILRA